MEFSDRTRQNNQQQKWENPGFHRQRPDRNLFRAQYARDAGHPAIEDREDEQGSRDEIGLCSFCHREDLARSAAKKKK